MDGCTAPPIHVPPSWPKASLLKSEFAMLGGGGFGVINWQCLKIYQCGFAPSKDAKALWRHALHGI